MEIKVGDYVRLDRCQGINRIDEIDEIGTFYLENVIGNEWGNETFRLDTNDVINSSPNIIDLIEVGDYVNGKKVIDTYTDYIFDYSEEFKVVRFSETDILHNVNHIKSIVTKEQFESMEYKICTKEGDK